METEQLQNKEAIVSDTTNILNTTKENELIKSSETKGNTKSLLESICSDFQNIDVFSPKDKLSKESGQPGNSLEINKSSNTSSNKGARHSISNTNQISNHLTNVAKKSEASTSVVPAIKDSPTCTVSAATNIKAALQQCGIQKPVSEDSIITNNKIISSSLAEVADAEIVQTDDNLVSIIITNPRLIQVLNSEDGKQQYSSLPQTVGAAPGLGSLDESVVIESSPVGQQDLAFQSEISAVADEIIYDARMQENSPKKKYKYSTPKKYKFSSTPKSYRKKGKTKAVVIKQKTDSGRITKARRISAKMKIEWAKTLSKRGSLVCPMQGCYQKYVTIANFVTHYKFCPGQTELKHCPHCSSLIFSDNKAMLHHMEVEHPDKVEEFKANVSDDDESSALYDEEDIPETPTEKRKISSLAKENQSPKGRKHKIFKSIAHETEIENIKEFRKCVRFDDIVSKINSCDQVESPDDLQTSDQATNSKSPKERKRRLVLTGKIVEEEKYFEDADEFLTREPKEEDDNFKLNTKSRLVLNLERYKQFNQHLKLTRDWSSARKTYSRSRISDSSLDNSFSSVQSVADCPKDDHQLDDLRLKSSNGEDDTEVLYYANIPKELSEYDLQDPKAIQRTRPSLISQSNSERKRVGILREKVENTKEIESQIVATPSVYVSPSTEKPQNGFVLKEKKVPCYLRDTISNSTSKGTPEGRKPVVRVGPVITYGKNIPTPEETKMKAEKCSVVDFDTLFKNSMKEMKLLREKTEPVVENISEVRHLKENGIKEPPVIVKRKRGRPKKIRDLPEEEQTNANTNSKEDGIKLVDIEKNVDIEQNAITARNLKRYARAYIKSKRQRSIKNLNSKRAKQSHAVIQNPPSAVIDDTKTSEVTDKNTSIKTNENAIASLLDKTMPDFKEQNSCAPTVENFDSKLLTTEPQQNLDSIPEKMALSSPLEVEDPNKLQAQPNKDINIVESVECAIGDVPSTSINTNSETKQNTEILKPVIVDTDVTSLEASCVHSVANEQCSVQTIPAASAYNEEATVKANIPTSNDTQILNNVTEPVKRRRGRPKKIVSNTKAKVHTAAVTTASLHSEIVQSKTVTSEAVQSERSQSDAGKSERSQSDAGQLERSQSDAGQLEAVQIDASQSEAPQSNAGQSEVVPSDAGQSEATQSDTGLSDAEQSKAVQSDTMQSDAGRPEAVQSDAGQSEAVQSDAGQPEAVQSDAGQPEAVQSDAGQPEAVQSDAGQPEAVQSDAGQPEAVQSDAGQPEAVQSDAGQPEAVQSDAGQSKAVQSDAGQPEAAQSDAGQSEATQSDAGQSGTDQLVTVQSSTVLSDGQSVAVQSDSEQSLAVQSAAEESNAGQSVAVHSDFVQSVNAQSSVEQSEAAMSDLKQSDVPIRKSLRNKNRNSSHPNEYFVFPTNKKEPKISEEHTPPVRTGRRGRPRKYPLKIDLNSSASETLPKDDLNSSTGEHTLKNDLSASASETANESINSFSESKEQLPIAGEQVIREKKKCGRPRKYPLKRDLNSSISESDNCAELEDKPITPARKRGRPRKYPLKSDLISPNQLNNSVDSVKPINKSETSQTAVRKCPRKGRPVKCVHYEALNSHKSPPSAVEIIQEKKVEESLDNSCAKTEVAPSTVKNKDSKDPSVGSKPEKFILPPKKRKISGEDESIALIKEKAKDPDYLDSEEISDEESDVEQTKKLKKRTEADLPYVPEKRLKKHLKKSHSPSKKVAVTPVKPSFQFLAQFSGAVYEEKELYPNLKPIQSMFTALSEGEWQEFLPPVDSISIRLDTAELRLDTAEKNWIKLKCFESLSNGALKYLTFFTGGPVSTSAFCPTPRNKMYDQYIALASNYDFLNMHYSSTKAHKGLIQIYNLGNLQDLSPPVLELALCHKNATITNMQWCPRGCYQEPPILSNRTSTSNVLPRLGLLAVACADSFIRIYSIPHPKFLTGLKVSRVNSLPFFNSSPSVILEPMCGTTRSSIATSLTWANTADCEQIAVGYGNGMVGVWLVNTTNTILLTSETAMVKTIIPYMVFQAHGTPVTSLQFAPLQNCRYLVSSGFDKTLKFFDLMDTSIPFSSAKRGCAISCQWSSSLCGAFVSLHDGITFKGSNYFKDAGTEEFPIQTISGSISSITQSCVSDAINVLATADMKGSVAVKLIARNTLCGSDPGKLPPLHTYRLFKAEVTSFQNAAKSDMLDIKKSVSHLKDVIEITAKLTTQVESDLISEYNENIESSVSKVMDDILITAVGNSNLLLANEKQQIRETDVLNLVTSLCESTVHSINSLGEESSQEDSISENMDTSCILEDVTRGNNNMDSQEMSDIDDKLDTSVLKDSDNFETTPKQIIEKSDNLTKTSDSLVSHNKPYNISEVVVSTGLKSEVNSSAVNSFISENDSEVTGALTDAITSNPQNEPDTETTVLPVPSEGKQEFDSQEMSQIIDISDDDSFSSEDIESDKESDNAFDEELNFSEDSMMSECSLSSKSSESSYSSDNAMDESVSIDYIQDIESRCSPIPHDSSLIKDCVETSELKCNPSSKDLSLTEDCTQNSEVKSSPISNPSSLSELCTQNSKLVDAPATEDCIETFASKDSPTPNDSSLAEDCSQTIDSMCGTLLNDSALIELHNSSSPETSSDSGLVDTLGSQEILVPSSPPANTTDNAEISNDNLPKSDFVPRTLESEMCVSTECDFPEKNVLSKDSTPKNLEPSIQQFYKQQTRTSKPYMQAFKSVSEASVNNVECESSLGETTAAAESEAYINHCSSYKDIVSNHGIVFKDMHLVNTAECTITNEEEDKLPALEHNNFSSVNTIAWNPNHGCEYWLFSAGNSGIARLCCVSEINVPERMFSRRKNT